MLKISFCRRMEAGSSAVDVSAAAKSGQQMTNEKEEDKEKCESGGEQTTKEKEEKGSGMVTWCTGVAGMGLFLTVVKNIISGVTDVMVKTTFDGINPITLVFLRYILNWSFYHIVFDHFNHFDLFILFPSQLAVS